MLVGNGQKKKWGEVSRLDVKKDIKRKE